MISFRPQGTTQMKDRHYGVYKFDGDTLMVCIGNRGQARPDAFETKLGDDRTLYILKRMKSADGPATRPTTTPRSKATSTLA